MYDDLPQSHVYIYTQHGDRRLIKDSRTVSESHYHIYKRYFGFLCYNALFVFIVTTSIMETVRRCVHACSRFFSLALSFIPRPPSFGPPWPGLGSSLS